MARIQVLEHEEVKIQYTILNEEVDPSSTATIEVYDINGSLDSVHTMTIDNNTDEPDVIHVTLDIPRLPDIFTTIIKVDSFTCEEFVEYHKSIYTLKTDKVYPVKYRLAYLN